MNTKIAVGIINTHDGETFKKCTNNIPKDYYVTSVHNTTNGTYNRYISYGGLLNIILRDFEKTDATYYFILKSNCIVQDSSIFQDYINTAAVFGTWFMLRGSRKDTSFLIEDDVKNININLYENINFSLIFMLKSHVKHCGYFDEGFTNLTGEDNNNCLELYDYYNKIEKKFNYLPKGYFPDAELSLAKITDNSAAHSRPNLKDYNNNNITHEFAKFYNKNKFAPGQHKTASRDSALTFLENIQKQYAKNI
jgi:hypothetical protein